MGNPLEMDPQQVMKLSLGVAELVGIQLTPEVLEECVRVRNTPREGADLTDKDVVAWALTNLQQPEIAGQVLSFYANAGNQTRSHWTPRY
jgi:hypothetical protein